MQSRSVIFIALFIAAIALSGCAAPKDGATTAPSSPAGNNVIMKNIEFRPGEITISAGESVTWKNDDALGHDVTPKGSTTSWSEGGVGGMAPGESFTRKFDTAGTFDYYCQAHGSENSGMLGKVIVT